MTSKTFTSGTVIDSAWLNDVNGATYNGTGAFIQAGTGAVARTLQDKARESVSVLDFGAIADASTDIGAALQKAHDALPSSGGTICIPAGSTYYYQSTTVAFTKPVRIVGDGIYNTAIYADINAITLISSYSRLDIEGVHFEAYGSARTTATLVLHQPTAANHGHSTFFNCRFDGGNACYHTQSCNAVVFDNCEIYPQGNYGLWLENLNGLPASSDAGDSFITNCTFSGSTANSHGIYATTTSGLYISNNKFNDERRHILIDNSIYNVGNNIITGNSFEGHVNYAVKLNGSSGVSTKNLITGNQFSSGAAGVNLTHLIIGVGAINNVVTGNVFNSIISSDTLHIAVNILSGSYNTTITGNAFHQIYNAIICPMNATLGITMHGNRFSSDVTQIFQGDDGQSFGAYGSSREINCTRYFAEAAGTLTSAYRFQGKAGTLEIMVYGVAQGVGNVNYSRKVAIFNDVTVNDINAALLQGTGITVALTNVAGYTDLQVAKASGTGFTGYVEVIARGQINYVKAM